MSRQSPLLAGLSAEEFLHRYWQKKPLLIRGAVPDFCSPITPDELAGLACEEVVESRMVIEKGGDHPWQLLSGPFDEQAFAQLPSSHWTLLVQEVHKYLPELALLLEQFRFIPNWRIDDIMVSYSPEHGSVGPHIDYYDVFLLQAEGRKRWQISSAAVTEDALIPDIDLRILKGFEPEQEWVLEAGDMLYLPAAVIHHGVALEPGFTYSVGFRAPTHQEMVGSWLEQLLSEIDPQRRYADPELTPQAHPGEITPEVCEKIRQVIYQLPQDAQQIDRWFGRFVTEAKAGNPAEALLQPVSVAEFMALFKEQQTLWRSEFSRFAFIDQPEGLGLTLFVGGEESVVEAALAIAARRLCDWRCLDYSEWSEALKSGACRQLLCDLFNQGHLCFETPCDED